MGKEQSLQQTMMGQMDFHKQRMKLDPYFTPFTKIISKCIFNLNMRAKTMNLLEENIGQSFMTLDFRMDSEI